MPLFCDAPRAADSEGMSPLPEGIDEHLVVGLSDARRAALCPTTQTSHQEHPLEPR